MIVVASSLSLLAVVAGMFLYAKTIKDNLNLFYKIVASFIIIIGFINLFAGSAVIMIEKIYSLKMNHQKKGHKLCGTCGEKHKKHKCKLMSCQKIDEEYGEHLMKSNHGNRMCNMSNENCCSAMMDLKSMKINSMMLKKDSTIKNK